MCKTSEPIKQENVNNNYENKKNEGKEYIFRKFFKTEDNIKKNNTQAAVKVNENPDSRQNVIESSLDKQESFFAKFLNGGMMRNEMKDAQNVNKLNTEGNIEIEAKIENNRITTPICNIVPGGDDSNDTAYSGSTINEEINKSIALFEEDTDEVARVSRMREVLQNHMEDVENVVDTETMEKNVPSGSDLINNAAENTLESINCHECSKTISLDMLDEHADFHLALRLREEERQLVRKERDKDKPVIKEPSKKETKKKVHEEYKNDPMSSMSNFLVKFDETTPIKICMECGKKVAIDKFSEHLDFHEAQKLSRELNNRNLTNCSSSSVKRKRKSTSPVKKPKVPCKSIDLFFR